jgi:hypothetical protein
MSTHVYLIINSFAVSGGLCSGIEQNLKRGLQSGRNENSSQGIHK